MNLQEKLKAWGQEHLIYFAPDDPKKREEYFTALSAVDFEAFARARESAPRGHIEPISGLSRAEIEKNREKYLSAGASLVREGKVAAVLLAGGQGTRLGWNGPKGTFDIGVTRPRPIFGQLIGNLLETVAACGGYVPLYIMTSEKNDKETRAFFREHGYFSYPPEYVKFFVQDMSPCVGLDGKVLLEERGKLALSPNGNGGWYSSMEKAGLTEELRARGVKWLNVFAVDNVLQRIADPVFVGACEESGFSCGAKVVKKARPEEKVGVLCLEDGKPSVVEYYELSPEMANEREGGELVYRFGVILNYLFRLDRLEEVAGERIPLHAAKKKIPCIDEEGRKVTPETENGYKFETLILDMVRLMGDCLPFEVEREREFAPVKNASGVDSVESARLLLQKNGAIL